MKKLIQYFTQIKKNKEEVINLKQSYLYILIEGVLGENRDG